MKTSFISPDITNLYLEKYMREALNEAELAGQAGELPIGAVVVIDGEIVARGQAQQKSMKNQLRHAELNAMLDGGERLWQDYKRAILFSTVEPCPLCLGAAVMADIPYIIFALHDQVIQSSFTVENNPYVRRHIQSYFGGVLAKESAALFEKYDPLALKYIQTGQFLSEE